MSKATRSMDLHQAVENFLAHTEKQRSEIVHKRYTQAMELLMSFVAVELLDPESPDTDGDRGPAGRLAELTPDVLRRYTGQFLTERLGADHRVLKRHLLATRAFIRYLAGQGHLEGVEAERLTAVVRTALRSVDREHPGADAVADHAEDDPDLVQLYRVLHADLPYLDLENMVNEEVVERVRLANPDDYAPRENDICMMKVEERDDGFEGRCLGVLDSAVNFAEGATPETLARDAFDDADSDMGDPDEDLDVSAFYLSPEDALEILAVEDRYAPRGVVQAVLDGYDLVRDELMEWVSRDEYRDNPFPGAGEAPANAARILSEMGEVEILDRLLEVLGDQDPLGEEAPVALARLGPDVMPEIERVLGDRNAPRDRLSAAAWALGFMAARHPAVRADVLNTAVEIVEAGGPAAADALQILGELRAAEVLARLKRSSALGRIDLDALSYTPDLLEHQITAPNWGEAVVEALVPLLYLYPTEEELEELYSAVEDELEDWDPLAEAEQDEEEDEEEDEDRAEKRSSSDRPDDDEGGKVIPFTPNSPKSDKE